MKAAGKTEGNTWPTFWSQCSKDFAANNPGAAAAPEKPNAKKAKAKSTLTSRNENDSAGSAQLKKDCDASGMRTGLNGRSRLARLLPVHVQLHVDEPATLSSLKDCRCGGLR